MKDITPLVNALIDALLLLEFCGPDEVDPDTAVRGLESISSSLCALSAQDQTFLRSEFIRIAALSEDPRFREHIASLPDIIGLS